jgi:drug/metabolite transporter (DMT)-like permease
LGRLHILALFSSVLGAVIVSRPDPIAPIQQAPTHDAWIGYSFALMAGICSGGLFICSRKSQDISPLVMSFSVSLQEGLSLWAVATIGLVEDGPLEPLLASPFIGAAWVAGFVIIFIVTIASMSAGSQLCPALASSSIYTSVSMSIGYVAQTVIHQQHLKPSKVAGAGLMLLAVALVAAARYLQSKEASGRELADPLLSGEAAAPESSTGDSGFENNASLASFIASEFSGVSSSRKHSVRRRSLIAAAEVFTTLA